MNHRGATCWLLALLLGAAPGPSRAEDIRLETAGSFNFPAIVRRAAPPAPPPPQRFSSPPGRNPPAQPPYPVAPTTQQTGQQPYQNVQAAYDAPIVQYQSRPVQYQPATQLPRPSNTEMIPAPPNPVPYRPQPAQSGQQTPALQYAVTPPLDLLQVTGLAQQYNPILRRAVARIQSAEGDALQAGLYPNPRMDTNNPEVFAGPNSNFNVGFMQDLVVKGKLRLNRAAANQTVRQKQLALIQDRFAMLTAIRQQFYTTLAAQRRVEVLTELVQIAFSSLRAAEGRMKAGEGTLPEALLVKTEAQRAEIALKNAQTMLDGERKQLAAIIGLPALPIGRVSAEFERGTPAFDDEMVRQYVISENAQVQIARRDIDRNRILLERARVEPYPNVRVGPAYSYGINSGQQQFWLTLQFDIPTWDRNQGNIRSSQGDVVDSLANLGVVQNDLLRQVEDALARYRAARELAERIEQEILPNARRAQQLVKDGYAKGILDVSTFLQAQRALSETTLSHVDALEDVWTTAAELANLLQMERFP